MSRVFTLLAGILFFSLITKAQSELPLNFNREQLINSFASSTITGVLFSSGSIGCFHRNSSTLKYELDDRVFKAGNVRTKGGKYAISLMDYFDEFEEYPVKIFIRNLASAFDTINSFSIADFQFSSSDYKKCRERINSFHEYVLQGKKERSRFTINKNNIDFNQLLSLVDSIPYLTRNEIKLILDNRELEYSTTTIWKSIEFTNERNDRLIISLSTYSYIYDISFWELNLNGYRFTTTTMGIDRLLEKIYPSFRAIPDKVELLQEIVGNLYLLQLKTPTNSPLIQRP